MRKSDLIKAVADETGLHVADARIAVEAVMSKIKQEVTTGGSVYLRGFGTFQTKTRAAKTGRDIKRNRSVQIPAHQIPFFKPAKAFKETVKSAHV